MLCQIVLALSKHPLVDKYDLSSLQSVMSGAAPLSKEIQEVCAARLKILVKQGWGMTELSPLGTACLDVPTPPGSSGLLAPGTEGKVVCLETGRSLPRGRDGEVCVRGPQVMLGYLDNKVSRLSLSLSSFARFFISRDTPRLFVSTRPRRRRPSRTGGCTRETSGTSTRTASCSSPTG